MTAHQCMAEQRGVADNMQQCSNAAIRIWGQGAGLSVMFSQLFLYSHSWARGLHMSRGRELMMVPI